MLKAAPMALLPILRSRETNCSLLMKENDPAKRSMPPHPALKDGGADAGQLVVADRRAHVQAAAGVDDSWSGRGRHWGR
jgi:hypothetical protein